MVTVNWWGLGLLALVMVPNLLFALRGGAVGEDRAGRALVAAEQIGRYGVMLLLCVNIGPLEFGFGSDELFAVWLIGAAALLLAYWAVWLLFFRKQTRGRALALAVLPGALFLWTGLLARHWALLGLAALFAAAHIALTAVNTRKHRSG